MTEKETHLIEDAQAELAAAEADVSRGASVLRRRDVTLADLQARDTGPDLTPYDIRRISNGRYSDETVRREIQRGRLTATPDSRGHTIVHWIAFAEVKRWLVLRGLLKVTKAA